MRLISVNIGNESREKTGRQGDVVPFVVPKELSP